MFSKTITVLCFTALSAAAAYANGSPRSSKPGDDKVICRSETKAGSRLRKERTCHTRAEWAEIRRQTKQDLERIQNQPPISGK